MALQSSGPISIGNINTEFGFAATTPRSLSQLYRNGGIVGAGAPNVPTSGPISLSQFYGAANQFIFAITTNQTNLDLRAAALAAGWDGNAPLIATINNGIYVTSSATGTPALTISGSFPGGVSLTNNGYIIGMGGAGGGGGGDWWSLAANAGGAGGVALSVASPATINNTNTIAGGGGGGGGGGGKAYFASDGKTTNYTSASGAGGGGGRSGNTNSAGGFGAYRRWYGSNLGTTNNGYNGTLTAAGAGGTGAPTPQGGNGGAGGNWGTAGAAGAAGVDGGSTHAGGGAGAAGAAVAGNANITWVNTGTRLGAINT